MKRLAVPSTSSTLHSASRNKTLAGGMDPVVTGEETPPPGDAPPEVTKSGSPTLASALELKKAAQDEVNKMLYGDRMDVHTLRHKVLEEIALSLGCFAVTQFVTAYFAPYMRPLAYDIAWAVVGILIGIVGFVATYKESTFGVGMFVVLLITLACINISHTLTMRSEHVGNCNLNQLDFMGCNAAASPSLTTCLLDNSCKRDQIKHTPCKAPGVEHCAHLDSLNYAFIFNILVSFFTFGEPAYWCLIYHARLEIDQHEKFREYQAQQAEEDLEGNPEQPTETTPMLPTQSI